MRKNKLILMIGARGSGKTYKCNSLTRDSNWVRIDFKDTLVDCLCILLGWKNYNELHYEYFKSLEIDLKWPLNLKLKGSDLLERLGSDIPDFLRISNIWALKWEEKVLKAFSEGKNVCVGDCRLPHEINIAEKFNPEFIFCNFISSRYDSTGNHKSRLLAQRLISLGFQDDDQLTFEQVNNISNSLNWNYTGNN